MYVMHADKAGFAAFVCTVNIFVTETRFLEVPPAARSYTRPSTSVVSASDGPNR